MATALAEVKKRYEAAREARRLYERQWYLNLAFVLGEQWVAYDKRYNTLRLTLPSKGPRLVSNIIAPRVRLELAALTKLPPAYRVECPSMATSRIIHYYLDYLWRTYKYEKVFRDALLWAIVASTGFVKVFYDPDVGPVYGDLQSGDPRVDSCAPFELLWDPYARDVSEASWVIHERVRSRKYVKQKYGKDVGGAPADSMLMSVLGSLRINLNTSRLPSTTVCEYWERPNPDNPEGLYVVYSGSTVLYEGPNPYADTCPIPFVKLVHTPVPGEFYGTTWVSDTRQVNVLYNRLRNDILENAVKLSNPPLLAPMGSIPGEIKMNPGEVIAYNPLVLQGGRVDQLKIEPFPAQAVNMLVRLEQEADEMAGVTALTRGGMPRGVRSAQQLSTLVAMEDQRRQISLQDYTNALEDALTYALRLARKYLYLPRKLGSGNNAAFVLRGSDIPPDAQVKVTVDLHPPEPDEREEQRLLALFDRGVLQDPRLLVRLLQYGSKEEVFADIDLDEAQVQRENTRLADGVQVMPEDFHNHMLHIVEHNRFRKTEVYEQLPPERKQLFAQHVAVHQQFMQAAQAQKGGEMGGGHSELNSNSGPTAGAPIAPATAPAV